MTWRLAWLSAALAGLLVAAPGCGMQNKMLGATGGLLLQGADVLAQPGQEVTVAARLQGGDFLQGLEGYLVGFYQLDHKLGEARTDEDGWADIKFTPTTAGNHVILAKLEDPDVRRFAVAAVEILVAARDPAAAMAVVDIDHTLVADGFDAVLAGHAEPLPDSQRVLERLSKERTIIYLTHRPEIFTEQTRRWLHKYNYPLGPLLTSTAATFLKGSKEFKTVTIGRLKESFHGIDLGIGDQPSDAEAYRTNGLQAVLILYPDKMKSPAEISIWLRDLRKLPADVEAVESWRMIEQVLFEQGHFPISQAIAKLVRLATQRYEQETGIPAPPGTGVTEPRP